MPYTPIFAAFMLATLISALFALPAQAVGPGDLAVTSISSVPNVNVKVGQPITYTITVTNLDGSNPSVARVLTDNIGAGAGYVGDTSGGLCAFVAPNLTCPVPAGIPSSGIWSVQVTVNATVPPGVLANVASLDPDGVPANDSATKNTNAVGPSPT